MMCVREHPDKETDTGASENKQNLYIFLIKKENTILYQYK